MTNDYVIQDGTRKGSLRTKVKKSMPQRFMFWDCETIPTLAGSEKEDEFNIAVTWNVTLPYEKKKKKNVTMVHYSSDDLNKYVQDTIAKQGAVTMIAHNASYDIQVSKILEHFIGLGFQIKVFHNKGSSLVIVLKKEKYKLVLLDSMNWYRVSLEKLGKSIGTEKQKVDFNTASQARIEVYCKQDVRILLEAFDGYKRFLTENFNVNMGYTISQDAFTVFKNSIRNTNIPYNNNMASLKFQYNCYYGGRVECFQYGELKNQKWFKVDVNSLYPYVMSKFDYPVSLPDVYVKPALDQVMECASGKVIAIDCILDTNDNCYPYRTKRGLIFPTGCFRTYLSGNEAAEALKRGAVQRVMRLECYQGKRIFKKLIDQLYKFKQEASESGNGPARDNVKILMNSIYGKFGQKVDQVFETQQRAKSRFGSFFKVNEDGDSVRTMRIIDHKVYDSINNVLTNSTFPIMAATITANARMYLWKFIEMAGIENCMYCDTDSLILNKTGYENISKWIDNDKIGYWKTEGVSNKVSIFAPKWYKFGDEIHLKGVPKSALQVGMNEYKFEQWRTLNQSLFQRDKYKGQRIEVTKVMNPIIWKNLVDRRGRAVPFRFDFGQKYARS